MIQFTNGGQRSCYFEAPCPVCEATTVRLVYVYEWAREDFSSGTPAWQEAHSPCIVEQTCRCLLGQNFCDDALDDYLDREEYDSRR